MLYPPTHPHTTHTSTPSSATSTAIAMSSSSSAATSPNVPTAQSSSSANQATAQFVVQSIFSSTSCYDLMQSSSKGTVFETTIPFQLAFFALIEHETDVAPLWDPELRAFVGLLTVEDYIRALRLCLFHNINAMELTTKSISDMLIATPFLFQTQGFHGLEAEERVSQLIHVLLTNNNDSRNTVVPIVDPESGQLVSLLAPLDVLHLLDQIARINESLFAMPISALRERQVGTYCPQVQYTTRQALLRETLDALDSADLSALPIVESESSLRVVSVYHKCDVSFIMKAPDPEAVLQNLRGFRLEDSLAIKDAMLASGELSPSSVIQGLVIVQRHQSLGALLKALVSGRTHRAYLVDEQGCLQGVISFRDLLQFFLELNVKK